MEFLDALLGDHGLVPVDEVVREHFAFPVRALAWRLAQDLPATIGHLEQHVVAEVPVGARAGIPGSDLQFAFPRPLQLRDAMLLKQRLAAGLVFGSLAEIRAHLSWKRSVDLDVAEVIEERVQPIEVPLRDRIVLVVMALGAFHCQAEPGCGDGIRAVEGLLEARLLVPCAALSVAQGVPMEAGGGELIGGRVLEQVRGQLERGELVERHVVVQRVNDPIAPAPSVWAVQVLRVAVRIRVPG